MDTIDMFWKNDELHIVVNGHPLQELIAVVERPSATADDQSDLAGNYSGLRPYSFGKSFTTFSDHFLGGEHSHLYCGPHDKTVLLACECGEVGCWPLMARVAVDGEEVIWSDFHQPYRERWDYGRFSLTFDCKQYGDAVQVAQDSTPVDLEARSNQWLGRILGWLRRY